MHLARHRVTLWTYECKAITEILTDSFRDDQRSDDYNFSPAAHFSICSIVKMQGL